MSRWVMGLGTVAALLGACTTSTSDDGSGGSGSSSTGTQETTCEHFCGSAGDLATSLGCAAFDVGACEAGCEDGFVNAGTCDVEFDAYELCLADFFDESTCSCDATTNELLCEGACTTAGCPSDTGCYAEAQAFEQCRCTADPSAC